MLPSIHALIAHDRIRAARAHIEHADETTLARQAALSAIPAPTGAETARARRVADMFADVGLTHVGVDDVGNVRAWHGTHTGSDCVMLSAHLDTVFGPDLDVSVARRGPRLEGPGIADNARGLAALVTVAEAFASARVATARPILFAATVGEEGAGDLRGVKHLFGPSDRPTVRPSAFIALDGAGIERIVHRALGSRRYRITYHGPGGHSWAAFGVANPANAVGRATAALAEIKLSHSPRSSCAVVRLGGGTSLNSLPQSAWLDVDLRSEEPRTLEQLDEAVRTIVAEALADENRHRLPGTPPLTREIRRLGERPSGLTPRTHPLVQIAV